MIVRDRRVDFCERETEFGGDRPAEAGAEDGGAKVVEACFGVADHDGKVFGDVVQEDLERVGGVCGGGSVEYAVAESVCVCLGVMG